MNVKFKDIDKKNKLVWVRMYFLIYGICAFFVCLAVSFFTTFWVFIFGVGIYLLVYVSCRGIDKDLFEYYKKYGVK